MVIWLWRGLRCESSSLRFKVVTHDAVRAIIMISFILGRISFSIITFVTIMRECRKLRIGLFATNSSSSSAAASSAAAASTVCLMRRWLLLIQ